MKVNHNHKCNGCLADNTISFIKPSALSPSVCKYTCTHCGSEFVLKVIKPKGSNVESGQVDIIVRVINFEMSPKLRQILLDKKESARSQQNPFDKMG